MTLPSLIEAKKMARDLRAAATGHSIGHAQALEHVARTHGYRDWNAFHATIRDLPPRAWQPGARITGRYLSHAFTGTVLELSSRGQGWFRIEIDLDEGIDVVTSRRFSNTRKRIRGDIGPSGQTRERLSDGTPHLVVDLP